MVSTILSINKHKGIAFLNSNVIVVLKIKVSKYIAIWIAFSDKTETVTIFFLNITYYKCSFVCAIGKVYLSNFIQNINQFQ